MNLLPFPITSPILRAGDSPDSTQVSTPGFQPSRRLMALVVTFVIGGIVWVALNRPRDIAYLSLHAAELTSAEIYQSQKALTADPNGDTSEQMVHWAVGGFPLDSYHLRRIDDSRQWIWLPLPLLINALAFLALVACVNWKGTRLTATGLTLCAAVAMAGYGAYSYRSLQELSRTASVVTVCSLGSAADKYLPESLVAPWTHVYHLSTSADVPERSIATTSVQSVTWHGSLDESVVEHLGQFRLLTRVRLRANNLDGAPLSQLQRLTQLRQLVLSCSSRAVDSATMEPIDIAALPKLTKFTYYGPSTAIRNFDQWQHPLLAHLQVEYTDGNLPSIHIQDSPELQNLHFVFRDTKNDQPLDFSLSNLPNLSICALSNARPLNLMMHEVPRLRTLTGASSRHARMRPTSFRGRFRGVRDQYRAVDPEDIATLPWIAELSLSEASSLRALNVSVASSHDWQINHCPNLMHIECKARTPMSDARQLLSAISRVKSLNSIMLQQFDLRNCDLHQLKNLPYLHSITFDACVSQLNQLASLGECERLVHIEANRSRWNEEGVQRLLNAKQDWVCLNLPWSQLQHIQIKDQPELETAFNNKSIRASLAMRAHSVELVNVPKLHETIMVNGSLDSLRIENCPSLMGILINGKLPAGCQLSELTNLEHFAVAGGKIPLWLEKELFDRASLKSLAVPGCQLNESFLRRLSENLGIVRLDLANVTISNPGQPPRRLSDSDTTTWGQFRNLVIVSLDGSDVGLETVEQLAYCHRLQSISLDGIELKEEDLSPLARLNTLQSVMGKFQVEEESPLAKLVSVKSSLDGNGPNGWWGYPGTPTPPLGARRVGFTMRPFSQNLGSNSFPRFRRMAARPSLGFADDDRAAPSDPPQSQLD